MKQQLDNLIYKVKEYLVVLFLALRGQISKDMRNLLEENVNLKFELDALQSLVKETSKKAKKKK
jgi:regulator of replication initiation timing